MRLLKFQTRLDNLVSRGLEYWKIPGSVIAFFSDKAIIDIMASGINNINESMAMDSNVIFPIGSCIKGFTSLLIGILVDQGKIAWDEPLVKKFEDLRFSNQHETSNLTIRDILSHKTRVSKNALLWDFAPLTREELFNKVEMLECMNKYNASFNYNNLMYSISEYLVERITKMPFEENLCREILNKLKLEKTTSRLLDLCEDKNRVHTYDFYNNQFIELEYPIDKNLSKVGSTLNSSITDMIKWIQLYLNWGKINGKQIVSKESLLETISPQTIVPNKLYSEATYLLYSMGWYMQPYRGKRLIFHEGRSYGCNVYLSFMPEVKLGVIIVSNREHKNFSAMVAYSIYDYHVFKDELPWFERFRIEVDSKKTYKPDSMQLSKMGYQTNIEQFIGCFENNIYGNIHIFQRGEDLIFQYYSLIIKLYPVQPNIFRGIPLRPYISMRNKLGYDFSLKVEYINYTTLIIHNEPEVKNIVFQRKVG